MPQFRPILPHFGHFALFLTHFSAIKVSVGGGQLCKGHQMAYVSSTSARPPRKSADFFDPSKGYQVAHNSRGRISVRSRSRNGNSSLFVMYAVLGFLFFKLIVLIHMGASAYNTGLLALSEGNAAQQVGARFLQVDPLTSFLKDMIAWVI